MLPDASQTAAAPARDSATSWLKKLGPGLITGAADDDPSGIATYSQAGAQFGFQMLWTILFTYPLMVGIQVVSARIGRVSGKGLAGNIREHFPSWLVRAIVALLLIANTVNIAADVSAMGEAVTLIAGGSSRWYAALFGLISLLLQVLIPYHRYVRFLKWLTLALLAYVATVFTVHVPWLQVAAATAMPRLEWSPAYITTMVAVFGTTISPYLFFWQASQEVEELQACPQSQALLEAPAQARANFQRIKVDTVIGMGFSNLVAFFIMLTTAVTLHLHGIAAIDTSAQAAAALRPLAGEFAFALFSAGIIGTGMLAVPVLAGSAAYAVAGALQWEKGLEKTASQAKGFYGIIAVSTIIGILLGFTAIDPIKALYWSAVINGVISVPIMVVMMLMAGRAVIMGRFVIGRRLRILGWGATAAMALAVLAMFWTMLS
ncbi:NRAMP family divalent metal transporter [Duganella violaceipulchra]|uniref:Divalent metal cation transporter n=1 Tax=Duganella violaceipulchra TaxID=2849652 RepID=A0AA41HFG9_9BURK|nr:divalent metal cation transporter [Duganella violaceicalia]MBV6323151.1 divalent metal cation transporter [Duganella violaceicalia]MCP2010063.1 NRAMP (natural resistance-associated macrophage protein)-like metal ion transporter [Duganella violaceicalia]